MKVAYCVLVLLSLLVLVHGQKPQCAADLTALSKSQYQTPVVSTMMQFSTGNKPNDLGNWDQCNDLNKDEDSMVAQFCVYGGSVSGAKAYMGLCVPTNCSESDINAVYTTRLSALLPIKAPFTHCTNSYAKMPEINGGAVVAIIIFVITTALALAGTYFSYYKSEQARKAAKKASQKTIEFSASSEDKGKDSGVDTDAVNVEISKEDAVETEKDKKSDTLPWYLDVLLCFAVQPNWKALLDTRNSTGKLGSLNGLRVLMLLWVMLAHSIYIQGIIGTGYDNFAHFMTTVLTRFSFQAVYSAELAVDIFFYLSGFLVTYLTYSEMAKNKPVSWVYYIVHRFWRLTPLYFFVLLIYIKLVPVMGSGPLWFKYGETIAPCQDYFWSNLIYINNWYPEFLLETCASWTWYLANDMQFYVLLPFLLVAYKRNRKYTWIFIGGLYVMYFLLNALLMDKYFTEFKAGGRAQQKLYMRPYMRYGPYLVGVCAAFLLVDYPERIKATYKKLHFRWLFYFLAFALTFTVTYSTYKKQTEWGRNGFVLYQAFARFAFTIGMNFLIMGCFMSYGGFFRHFLSAKFWNPLAKLTYSAYLIHPVIMCYLFFSQTQVAHWSWTQLTYAFTTHAVLAYVVGFVLHLLIEKPCANLERLLRKRLAKK